MTIAAIIVAAGRGNRAGGDLPKQWQNLNGAPVIARTIAALRPHVDQIAVVLHPDDTAHWTALGMSVDYVVTGASTRDGSVRAGLDAFASAPP